MYRSIIRSAYVKDLQEYIPDVQVSHLQAEKAAGVRALALDLDGNLVDDFVFDSSGKWGSILHIRNAPSPAATASFAISKEIADLSMTKIGLQ